MFLDMFPSLFFLKFQSISVFSNVEVRYLIKITKKFVTQIVFQEICVDPSITKVTRNISKYIPPIKFLEGK